MSLPERWLAASVGALLCGAIWAGAAAAVVREERLENGLTVLVKENPIAPSVAVSLLIRVGARWEREDEAGITNLLQHVMVKGAGKRTALEITEAAEDIGGSVGASADLDHAEIRGVALARHWKALLGLVADVALRPTLPDHEVENERRVALSRIRNRADRPFSRAFDALLEQLFGRHPYARPAEGTQEVLRRLDREALRAHFDRHYRAGRMVLSVSGQVSARDVVDEVGRLFRQAPTDLGLEVDATAPVPAPMPERIVLTHASAQAQVLLGFLAPPLAHPDYPAMKVLAAALGGGMSGRFFAQLRDKEGLAYSTGAMYPPRMEASFLVGYIGTAPTNATRAEEGMKREIEQVRHEPLTLGQLDRAKAYVLGQFALDRRTNARLAWHAAFFQSAGVGHAFEHTYPRAVAKVTADDVQRVANLYLTAPVIVRLEPSLR